MYKTKPITIIIIIIDIITVLNCRANVNYSCFMSLYSIFVFAIFFVFFVLER